MYNIVVTVTICIVASSVGNRQIFDEIAEELIYMKTVELTDSERDVVIDLILDNFERHVDSYRKFKVVTVHGGTKMSEVRRTKPGQFFWLRVKIADTDCHKEVSVPRHSCSFLSPRYQSESLVCELTLHILSGKSVYNCGIVCETVGGEILDVYC